MVIVVSGTFSVEEIPGNNGIAKLSLSVGVTVQIASPFTVVGYLSSSDSTLIDTVVSFTELAVGEHTVMLPFDGKSVV